MDPAAEAATRAGNDVLTADDRVIATSCGCLTRLVAWLPTPGIGILLGGSFVCYHAPLMLVPCVGIRAFTLRIRLMMCSSCRLESGFGAANGPTPPSLTPFGH